MSTMTSISTDKKASGDSLPMNIATISAGFEKGDFLVREEQGNRVYFDFFEEVRINNEMTVNECDHQPELRIIIILHCRYFS